MHATGTHTPLDILEQREKPVSFNTPETQKPITADARWCLKKAGRTSRIYLVQDQDTGDVGELRQALQHLLAQRVPCPVIRHVHQNQDCQERSGGKQDESTFSRMFTCSLRVDGHSPPQEGTKRRVLIDKTLKCSLPLSP